MADPVSPVIGIVLLTLVWYPNDPTPEIAARVEPTMAQCMTDEEGFFFTMEELNAHAPAPVSFRFWGSCETKFPLDESDPVAQKGT